MLGMFNKIKEKNSLFIMELEKEIKKYLVLNEYIFIDKMHLENSEIDSFYHEKEIDLLNQLKTTYNVISVKFEYRNWYSTLSHIHICFELFNTKVEFHFYMKRRKPTYSSMTFWSFDCLCGVEFEEKEISFKFVDFREKSYSSIIFNHSGFNGYVSGCEFLSQLNILNNLEHTANERKKIIESFDNFLYSTRLLDIRNKSFNSLNFISEVIKKTDVVNQLVDMVSLNYDINIDVENYICPMGFDIYCVIDDIEKIKKVC